MSTSGLDLHRVLALVLDLNRGRPNPHARLAELQTITTIVYAVDSIERLLGQEGSPNLRRAMRQHDVRCVVDAANELRERNADDGPPVTRAEVLRAVATPMQREIGDRGGNLARAAFVLSHLVTRPSASRIEKIVRTYRRP